MEDDRVAVLEAQLTQAKLIAEEADKKYEEVSVNFRSVRLVNKDILKTNKKSLFTG